MTILTPPAVFLTPSTLSLAPIANTMSGGRSPLDGTEQTLALPGSRFGASLGWSGLAQDEWRPLLAFIVSLNGMAGRFAWAPPLPRRATGAIVSGPSVATAVAGGSTVPVVGFAAGAQAARAGDLVSWIDGSGRSRLHMVTADVTADGAGACTLPVAPPLRRALVGGAAVNLTAPTAIWRLTQNRNPMDLVRGLIAGGTLEIEEALL